VGVTTTDPQQVAAGWDGSEEQGCRFISCDEFKNTPVTTPAIKRRATQTTTQRAPGGVRDDGDPGWPRTARAGEVPRPSGGGGDRHAPAKTPGLRHLAFAVDDIDGSPDSASEAMFRREARNGGSGPVALRSQPSYLLATRAVSSRYTSRVTTSLKRGELLKKRSKSTDG
jgi:hypothetical protein